MNTPSGTAASPRILIVRLSAIGDVILTMPVLNALRDAMPRAYLAWAVEDRAAALLEGHASLDRLIRLPRGFLKSPRTVWRIRRELRDLRPDVTIDVQGLSKSSLVAWLSGAKRRIGLAGQWGREISTWLNNELVLPAKPHVVDRMLELLRPLGIEEPKVEFRVPLTDAERAEAAASIAQHGLESGFAMLNPGAAVASKFWPCERFAVVARHLGSRWRLPSWVVWAGKAELALAESIVAESDGHARLAPPTTLRQLAVLAQRAQLFVSSDTGPLHLAVAVGTPCVGLYGPWPATETGPYGPQHVAIQKKIFHGKTRERRTASREYMEAIQAADVCAGCDEILGRSRGHS
jgi:lipopolysaccharide heptosyltransferase I